MTPWEIQGSELINCSCNYACPCQFNSLPTEGYCQAIGAFAIERGHYGDVALDGLKVGMAMAWPGPIHEGNGQCQPIIDSKATPAQREALLKIISGQDTDPGATIFSVFAATYADVFEPIVAAINYTVDIAARRGSIRIADVVQVDGEPIRNPITGEEHRVRIDLPNGFEYEIAEIGSGSGSARGKVAFDLQDSYAQFAQIHMNNHGLVRHRKTA